MWSSSGEDKFTRGGGSSSSSSTTNSSTTSLSSSSSSPFSPFPPLPNHPIPNKTMEEVWKDINLSSLHSQPSSIINHDSSINTTTSFQGMILQDFLGRPLSNNNNNKESQPTSVSPVPSPATILTLNSGPEFHFLASSSHLKQNPLLHPHNPISNFVINACNNGKKRYPDLDNNDSGDLRHKRMMKNRESAARSRARKQAYMQELMLEVSNLEEENARLEEQQRQLLLAAADSQHSKKSSLQRTSTAPF